MSSRGHQAPDVEAEASPFPPLTDAELRIARERLGLTSEWVATRLGVTERTVRRWEAGTSPVPAGVADQLGKWVDVADDQAEAWAARLLDVPEPVLVIPREGDRDGWPAGWWRALAARIVERVNGLRVTYARPTPTDCSPNPDRIHEDEKDVRRR